MKKIKLLSLFLVICTVLLVTESCTKAESCPTTNCNTGTLNEETCGCDCPSGYSGTNCETEDLCVTQNIVCENGGTCINGICECPDGFIGDNCEHFDPAQVQALLNANHTPKTLFDGGIPLDSLYGKMYEGGLIFYLNTTNGTGLVATTNDLNMEASWGCWGEEIEGADGVEIGTGVQNTIDISNDCPESGIAAKLCEGLDMNEQTDWFMPSKDELNLMWTNLADADENGVNTGLDDPGNLGGFAPDFYWCSTEGDEGYSWGQNFDNGDQNVVIKDFNKSVRAARAF